MRILFSRLRLALVSRPLNLMSLWKNIHFFTNGEKKLVKHLFAVVTYEQFKDMF